MWDTLEDFTAILTYTWDETKDDSSAAHTCMDESAKNDGRASELQGFQARTDTVITWVFMAIHVEEVTDKRTTYRRYSMLFVVNIGHTLALP
jgi:hypothetical protein